MAATLQLPYNVQRGASPSSLEPSHTATTATATATATVAAVAVAGVTKLMKKGAHLSRIIVSQPGGRDSVSPLWSSHGCAGSLPTSRSPSPRRPLTRQQSSSSGSRNGSMDDDSSSGGSCTASNGSSAAASAATAVFGTSPNTLSAPSPPRSVRVSPLPSPSATGNSSALLQAKLSMEKQVSLERKMSIDREFSMERQLPFDRQGSLDRQMSLERSLSLERQDSIATENEEIGGRTDDLIQAMSNVAIGKRKEVTDQRERQLQGLPAKRPKTVAEYAKSVEMSPLLLSPNPDAEALLSCLGFGGNIGPYSAPPFSRNPVNAPESASHSLEALAAKGLPASVLGKRYSAPPVMCGVDGRLNDSSSSGCGRNKNPGEGETESAESVAAATDLTKDFHAAQQLDQLNRSASAAVNMPVSSSAAAAASGNHRQLCRTDSEVSLPRPSSPAAAASVGGGGGGGGSVFLVASATVTTNVPSPSKYVSNRLRVQRRRSLQMQQAQLSIPEGSQEDLNAGAGGPAWPRSTARSVSPMPRQSSIDVACLEQLRGSLEDLGAFVFTGSSRSRDASPSVRNWRSMDDPSMREEDVHHAEEDTSAHSQLPHHGSLTPAFLLPPSSSAPRPQRMSRSSSFDGFDLCAESRQNSGASDDMTIEADDGSRATGSPSKKLSSVKYTSASVGGDRGRIACTAAAADVSRGLFGMRSSVPSVVLNDDEIAMVDVDARVCNVEDDALATEIYTSSSCSSSSSHRSSLHAPAAIARSPTPPPPLKPLPDADECSMSEAANWAGLTRKDPYSYDMARMLSGYSWERLITWNRYATEQGLQMPQTAGGDFPLPAAAPTPGQKTLSRTQSLAMPKPAHQSANRSRSLTGISEATVNEVRRRAAKAAGVVPMVTVEESKQTQTRTARERRAMFRQSSTKSSQRDASPHNAASAAVANADTDADGNQ